MQPAITRRTANAQKNRLRGRAPSVTGRQSRPVMWTGRMMVLSDRGGRQQNKAIESGILIAGGYGWYS